VLDGFWAGGSLSVPNILSIIDVTTRRIMTTFKLPVTDPSDVRMVTNRIALISHNNGLAALDLGSGKMRDLVQGHVASYSYDSFTNTLYFQRSTDLNLSRRLVVFAR
jgi:hypothetical protein